MAALLIRDLLIAVGKGRPFDTDVAREIGVSPALTWHYLQTGWLTRLERGVFALKNDNLDRDECLSFLASRIDGLHVGGKTALAWRGVRHNVAARERMSLWGHSRRSLPAWFTSRFPSQYFVKNLFSKKLPNNFGVEPLPESPNGPPVSVPERALLEMLSEVGVRQGIEEARNIMEGMTSVRPEVLQQLIKSSLRVKVTRLCVQWAEELNLEWAKGAREAMGSMTGKARWSARLKEGGTLILKP